MEAVFSFVLLMNKMLHSLCQNQHIQREEAVFAVCVGVGVFWCNMLLPGCVVLQQFHDSDQNITDTLLH